jgi:hypothetical protein
MFIRLWRAPPIDVFPQHDDPTAPNAGNYIIDPVYPAETYF